jgi:antitoxin HicB
MTSRELETRVDELLQRPYKKVLRGDQIDGYLAEAPELPGCVTAGETEEVALTNLHEAMAAWLESALANGIEIPEPEPTPEVHYSGRMLLRMPSSLHGQLAHRAEREGVSINHMAVTLLAHALGLPERPLAPSVGAYSAMVPTVTAAVAAAMAPAIESMQQMQQLVRESFANQLIDVQRQPHKAQREPSEIDEEQRATR